MQSWQSLWHRPSLTILSPSQPVLDETSLLNHFVVGFMPLLVRAEAHPGFREVSCLYIATSTKPWLRALFASVAALHLGQGTPALQAVADRYYQTALASYSRVLESGEARGTEDWLLSAAVFFYLYEQWRSGVASNIRQHLEGTAQLLRLRRMARRSVQQSIETDIHCEYRLCPALKTPSVMDRIAAESFLYHIAIVSIVDPDVDTLSSRFSWADVDEGLCYNPYPAASDAANSPVLGHGGAPSVYRLAFEVTRLGRHWPLVLYDRLEAANLRRTLDELKVAALLAIDPDSAAGASSPTVRLYLLAIEIYLVKLLDGGEDDGYGNIHVVLSSDPYVQHLAQAAMAIIRHELYGHSGNASSHSSGSFDDVGMNSSIHNQYGGLSSSTDLGWPMVILACAISEEADMQLLKASLIGIWQTSFCGYVRRIALVIERVWTWRAWPAIGEGEGIRDGLCLLTQPGGLAKFLNFE
ncbi:hypothetical protein SEUCBS139899_002377 [Sporothrix eucalyptigena]